MGNLDGTAALVTGGGSGIGLGCAVRLAEQGAAVTICGRTEDRLREAAAKAGKGIGYVVADVTDDAQVANDRDWCGQSKPALRQARMDDGRSPSA